ncbi:MAG: glycosyltransferase family 4 protein [Rhodospirillaceae bacterium]|jgi:glycosyltransferase involved in cell wall biosynthesis|nr:glycosyltransferase family 4 protein [Rhodospirillaceae bacterium]
MEKRHLVANVLVDGRIGGPQRRIVQVGTLLREMGWDTLAVFPPMGDALPEYLAEHGFRFAQLSLSRLRRRYKIIGILRYCFRFPIEVWALIRLFRRHKVDLVHANSLFAFQAVVAARLSGRPVVWHFNDMALPRFLCTLVSATLAAWATLRAYSSRQVLLYHRDRNTNKTALLYPPVDLEKFAPEKLLSADCSQWPELTQRDNEVILLAVGNVNPLKGYDDLVEALAGLQNLDTPWRMVVVGAILDTAEDYYRALKARIKAHGMEERFHCIGAVDDVPAALSGCDIFVMSSQSESGPMVLLEAMAAGKPPVASDVGLVSEVIENDVTGLIVPPRDSTALAVALKKMISDAAFREAVSGRTRAAITHQYTVAGAAKAHHRMYSRMLDGG